MVLPGASTLLLQALESFACDLSLVAVEVIMLGSVFGLSAEGPAPEGEAEEENMGTQAMTTQYPRL